MGAQTQNAEGKTVTRRHQSARKRRLRLTVAVVIREGEGNERGMRLCYFTSAGPPPPSAVAAAKA